MNELSFVDKEKITEIAKILKDVDNILFITGAGVSAESGLPTYRGIGGLYTSGKTEEGIPIEDALSRQMFTIHPEITWKYLFQIENACRDKNFNIIHSIIADFEKIKKRVWTITQNVDGFHTKAGSQNVIEIHGNFHHLYCIACDYKETRKDYEGLSIPPKCPKCNSLIRPDVVLFGEILPMQKLELFNRELRKGFDIIFSIGTTSVFPYISGPIVSARDVGIKTIEINPDDTYVSNFVTYKITSPGGLALEEIWNQLGIT